jgi:hypothetical protein
MIEPSVKQLITQLRNNPRSVSLPLLTVSLDPSFHNDFRYLMPILFNGARIHCGYAFPSWFNPFLVVNFVSIKCLV